MQESQGAAGAGYGAAGRALIAIARGFAVAGGLVFVALVAMEIVSIVGRKLFAWSVPGDVELLQMCAAFASAAFFAYCHLVGGDVKVDFFTHHLPARAVAALDAFGSLLVGGFGALIAWRTAVGAWSVHADGVTSAILGIPLWIAQGLMVPGFALLAVAGAYKAVHLLRRARGAGAPKP
ncbi:MAG: TRAP transporter small permease [Betaproteobacteria bacterium PRO3]|nr:TRAP transporter small permease [Betaproteobacteria bacterium PRO3]